MPMYRTSWFLFLILVAAAARTHGQTTPPPPASAAGTDGRVAWSDLGPTEIKVLDNMLESSDWAYRAVGLMRLQRCIGDEVATRIRTALTDQSWQVRCFAVRSAWRHGVSIDGALYAHENDPRVVRTAVRYGVDMPQEIVDDMTRRLLKIKTVDALLAGIELGAASQTDAVRALAADKTANLIRNMNPQIAAVVSRRLAAVLQIDPVPADIREWRQWLVRQPRTYQLPRPAPPTTDGATSIIAAADTDTFVRLRDYLGALRQRDLELVITIDATNSMGPMIDAVKADVDALILFLSDISSTMRLGLVAYRDHDNTGRLIEAHRFSTDLESLRNFLFGLTTPGGATYPEAVLDGIRACRQFEWNPQAERQIILIGDAPPHDADGSELRQLLEWYRSEGFTVHAVHVPQEWPAGYLRAMPPPAAQEREQWRQDYNLSTKIVFQEIANFGGGKLVELNIAQRHDLARRVMKLTILPEFWPYFDEFYDSYLELCR